MAKRNLNYYLLKLGRVSGWLLLLLMLLYIGTGFAMSGRLGFGKLIDSNQAKVLHLDFSWPLVGLFLVHTSITTYFAMRRWGWIKKRKC